jgi:transcriptional regulator with XRE-family HTH domain
MLIWICQYAYMRFDGNHMKALREGQHLDQHALAQKARDLGTGVTQSQISRYENGHAEPSGRIVFALASALGVSVGDLYAAGEDAPFQGRAA